jgi:hypothetical protein
VSPQIPFVLGLTLVAILLIVLIWWVPRWELRRYLSQLKPDEQIDLELKARGLLVQVVGGLFLVIGLYSTWKSFELSRRGQMSERLAKATEDLNTGKGALAVASIASLQQIAKDDPDLQWPVMTILAAYVRDTSPWANDPGLVKCLQDSAALQQAQVGEAAAPVNIQAALDVLKSQPWEESPHPLNLQGSNLRGADLRNGNFKGAFFNKSYLSAADLSGADLRNAHFVYVCFGEYTQCADAKTNGAAAPGAVTKGLAGCQIAK